MKDAELDFLRTPVWYPVLAGHTFLTTFVKLRKDALNILIAGGDFDREEEGRNPAVKRVIEDLRQPMAAIPGNCFVSVDRCAPTDTERFAGKRGAVFSPESAWKYLVRSEKVRESARRGEVEYICLRPFRRMNRTREFRLFLWEGRLVAMSQYNLDRHFRRLEGIREKLWEKAEDFVRGISWLLPVKTLVMVIYITASGDILIIDLNPWGEPTDPLLLRTWERNWSCPAGIVLMDPPTKISGDVSVSF